MDTTSGVSRAFHGVHKEAASERNRSQPLTSAYCCLPVGRDATQEGRGYVTKNEEENEEYLRNNESQQKNTERFMRCSFLA